MKVRLLIFLVCGLFMRAGFSAASIADVQFLIEQNLYAAAAHSGEQLLETQPGRAQVQFLTAYAYQMAGENKKAVTHYQMLIDLHPNLPEPRNNLAMIYLAEGDYDRASALLVEAINTRNSYATAYQNLNRIYTGLASEAYRRAVSESSKVPEFAQKIELTALSRLETLEFSDAIQTQETGDKPVVEAIEPDIENRLVALIKNWARAWSDRDVTSYVSYYSPRHHPNFETRSDWIDYRRERIMRPAFIRVNVSNFKLKVRDQGLISVDFVQAFESPGYRDRVIKRLEFKRVGSDWKISRERVISVL